MCKYNMIYILDSMGLTIVSPFLCIEMGCKTMKEQHKIFCDEYLIDFNGTRAYKQAYGEQLSNEVAAVNASNLLRKPNISQYIDKRVRAREKRTEIKQDDVVRSLKNILDANVTDLVNASGSFTFSVKDTSEIPKELQYAIKSIKPGRDGIEIEFYDKLKAAELLGKHLGMYTDNVNAKIEGATVIVDDVE